jgi:hypothetical protein
MFKLFSSLKDRLVEGASSWYRMWSSWLAVIWGVIVTAFWNDPEVFGELVNSLPEETRAVLSPIVLAVVTAIPILTRLLKQRESGPGKT